jgi:unsaturated rhamnogalacturonyl hydrolase
MPESIKAHAHRYIELFKNMAATIKAVQLNDTDAGFWPPSLLAYDLFPFPESSVTGFFVAGLAWGIRRGVLPTAEYLPVATRGWEALKSAQLSDGRIGWVQQIGAEPNTVRKEDTQLYGSGAFLQAAARMLDLAVAGALFPVSLLKWMCSLCGAPCQGCSHGQRLRVTNMP